MGQSRFHRPLSVRPRLRKLARRRPALTATIERLEDRSLLSTGSIAGTVFVDLDADGQRDAGEAPQAGVTVYLDLDRDGTLGMTEPFAVTTADGAYSFTGLQFQEYVVRQIPPAHHQPTSPQGATDFFYALEYTSGSLLKIDADSTFVTQVGPYGGNVLPYALALTRTGELFALDSGRSQLWKLDPTNAQPTLVGDTGRVVRAALAYDPVGDVLYGIGQLDATTMGLLKFDRTSGRATAAAGINGLQNFTGTISDAVWDPIGQRVVAFDNTGDALYAFDPTTGAATFLSQTAFSIGSFSLAYDSARGFLLHRNGSDSVYRVDLETGQLTLDQFLRVPPTLNALISGGPMFAHLVNLLPPGGEFIVAAADTSYDFGNYPLPPGSITGTAYSDLDNDGRPDPGEWELAGVTIYVDLDGDGNLDAGEPTTITDADGNYRFDGLTPGEYVVRQIPPSGFTATNDGTGFGFYYAIDGPNRQLERIDEVTGAVTTVQLWGPAVVPVLHGLAHMNDGSLYAIRGDVANDEVWKINPLTGELTFIGFTGRSLAWALAHDTETDTIYAIATQNGRIRLGVIDPLTGAFTFVGTGNGAPFLTGTDPGHLSRTGGIAFDDDRRRLIAYDYDGEIYAFDLDGNAEVISMTSSGLSSGLAYDGSRFVTKRRGSNQLIALDPDVGTWTGIGFTSFSFTEEAFEYVPGAESAHRVTVLPGTTHDGYDFRAAPLPSDIQGTVWNDLDNDGIRDPGEPGRAGVTVYLDVNQNGSYDNEPPTETVINPDDFAHGTVLTNAIPGVTLTGEFRGEPHPDPVLSQNGWFGHNIPFGTEGVFWGTNRPSLRADFDQPVDSVRVEVRSSSPTSGARGWIRAFDANGLLLAEVLSDPLPSTSNTTLEVAASGIAYVLVTSSGVGTPYILIDKLSFTTSYSEPTAVTDTNGDYIFEDVAPGRHLVGVVPPTTWIRTSPGNDENVYYATTTDNQFGSAGPWQLLKIDATTGAVTVIGDPLPQRLNGLIRTNTGELYGVSSRDSNLYVIDSETGAIQLVGPVGYAVFGGLAYDPLTDTIYAITGFVTHDESYLTIIDRATGKGTHVGPGHTGLSGVTGLAFDTTNRRLIAIDNSDGEFYELLLDGTLQLLAQWHNTRTWAFSQAPHGFVLQLLGTGDQFLDKVDPETGQPVFSARLPLSQALRLDALDWNYDVHRYVVSLNGSDVTGVDLGIHDPNFAPVAFHDGPYTITEGDSLSLSAAGSFDLDGDPLTYEWDLNADGSVDATGETVTISWAQLTSDISDNGTYALRLRVSDGPNSAFVDTTVTVLNASPVVTALPVASPTEEGQRAGLNVTIAEPSPQDSFVVEIAWGDGTTDIFNLAAGTTMVGTSHLYEHDYTDETATAPLAYTVTVTVRDDDDGVGMEMTTVAIDRAPAQISDVQFGYGDDKWIDSEEVADRAAPWRITQVAIVFDRDVIVTESALTVTGLNGPYTFNNFHYDQTTRRAVWEFATPITADRLSIVLDGDGPDDDGTEGVSSNTQYLEGGDYLTDLDVLFGDVSGDGEVSLLDSLLVRSRNKTNDIWADVSGDGEVSLLDSLLVRSRNKTKL